jgi:hypothetical protein
MESFTDAGEYQFAGTKQITMSTRGNEHLISLMNSKSREWCVNAM